MNADASTHGLVDLLGACSDATSLRAALDKLCAQFGNDVLVIVDLPAATVTQVL